MPRSLRIERIGRGNSRLKYYLTLLSESGEVVDVSSTPLETDRHTDAVAKRWGIDRMVIINLQKQCEAAKMEGGKRTAIAEIPEVEKTEEIKQMQYFLRPIKSAEKQPFSEWITAIDHAKRTTPETECVVEWDDIEQTCLLDLDFHHGSLPSREEIRAAADTLKPSPIAWWYSRSGSLHAMYHRRGFFSADTLAAVAGVSLSRAFPAARIEYKKSFRVPRGDVIHREADSDMSGLQTLASRPTASDGAVREYLDNLSFTPGQRYPHTDCPVSPSDAGSANSPPVCVYGDHIYCYICAANGIRRGSRTPGWFGYAALAGVHNPTAIQQCVANRTHWQHAQYAILRDIPDAATAKRVYRAMLWDRWGTDIRYAPTLDGVFDGPSCGIVRVHHAWADANGDPLLLDKGSAMLGSLPRAQYAEQTKTGIKLKTDRRIVEALAVANDLSAYGYASLLRVWGIHLTQNQTRDDDQICMVLARDGEPQYLHPANRMSEEDAWAKLQTWFPGVNRAAVELLIVAKGCTELTCGLPPMVFLYGPTGSGKSQTIDLAAAICGDRVGRVLYERNKERLYSAVRESKNTGSFASFDEYLKGASEARVSPDRAMEIVLTLTPDTLAHVLYKGNIKLGPLPVIIFADTSIPECVWNHAQIARRVHAVHLEETREWTYAASALRRFHDGGSLVADSLVSHIMDRWFRPGGLTDFGDVAKALGIPLLRDDNSVARKHETMRRFFDLVCSAPAPKAGECRASGRGWKAINLMADGNELTDLWKDLADESGRNSRPLNEADLKRVLRLEKTCKIDLHPARNTLFIRFIANSGDSVNEELKCSADGHRDAKCGGSPQGGCIEVPAKPLDTADVGGFSVAGLDWSFVDSMGSGESSTSDSGSSPHGDIPF